ncbi:hypothetical protein DUNSADRAFT_6999 [Dunaliella salina]|uniref:Uncharacterized protein n=1 Tax=Dunaliella salina TaxID=3046 RepID=A0ABQ7FTL0_DUNSA|nr:hypothetical protein DUNSADRAFT_6999 [Dunaliella salina]|eukprot:KAF5825783.1 hypothetical protein DUNSADRAFT_6999 [Dunaliella salina]
MVLLPSGDDRDAALLERKCYQQLRTAVRAWTSSRFSSLNDSRPPQSRSQQQPAVVDDRSDERLPSFPLASLNTGSSSCSQVDYDSSSSSSPSSSSPQAMHPKSRHVLSPASPSPARSSPSSDTSASCSSNSSSCSSNTTSPSGSPSPPKLAASTSSKNTALAAAHAKGTLMTPKHGMSVPSLAKSALEQGGIYLYKTSMDAQQLEHALAASKAGSRQGRHTLLMSPDSPICLKEFGYLDLFTLDANTADELGMLVGQFSTGITSLGQLLQGCISVRSEGSMRHASAQVGGPSSAPSSSSSGSDGGCSGVAALPLRADAAAAAPPKAAATAGAPPVGPSGGISSSGRSQGKPSTVQAHKGPCRITNSGVGRHMRGNASLC